jgi:DNA polymerase III subunit beta
MKITINREDLLTPLQAINNVVERRQTLPILGNVLVTAGEGESVTLTATDMEVEIVVSLEAKTEQVGAITIPARKFLDICRALPNEAGLTMTLAQEKVKIQSGRSRFLLATQPAAEFPSIGSFEPFVEFDIPVTTMRALVEGTQFAMAHQDVRYYLNGLLFELESARIRTVATDGHRLALCDRTVDIGETEPRQIIIPRKGVVEIIRMLSGKDETVRMAIGSNHLKVMNGDQSLTTKLVDGRFPDYERVVPRGGEKRVFADREVLKAGLARASILSNEKFRGVRIVLSDNKLMAIAHNPEQEEAEEEIEVEYNGGELEIGFNVSYLLDVLAVLKCDKVRVDFIDSNSSCLLQDPEDETSRYVVMPMRL